MTIKELEQFCKRFDLSPGDLEQLVFELKGHEAAMVNKSGFQHQLLFILRTLGSAATKYRLREIAHERRRHVRIGANRYRL